MKKLILCVLAVVVVACEMIAERGNDMIEGLDL
jgi:hypothetical protein